MRKMEKKYGKIVGHTTKLERKRNVLYGETKFTKFGWRLIKKLAKKSAFNKSFYG